MKHLVLSRYPIGNKRFNWKQKDFVLSTFGCHTENMREGIKNLKDAGFNLFELGWARHDQAWEAVDLCEEFEVDLILQDLDTCGGMMFRHLDRPVREDFAEYIVNRVKDKKHTIGYYVWDEPYSDEMYDRARFEMDRFQELDPDKLLFVVSMPCYNPPRWNWESKQYLPHLRRFAERLDPPVLSMDYYPIGNYPKSNPQYYYDKENQLDRDHMWCDIGALRLVGREKNLPIWFYYQGCDLYDSGYLTFPMIRMMMYAGVMYGAKGLQHYRATEEAVVNRADGSKGPFFEDQKAIHKEFAALGNTLMALENKLVYHSDEVTMPDTEGVDGLVDSVKDSNIVDGKLPRRCSVGEFTDGYGNEYILVLNRDYEADLNAEIALKGEYRFYEVSREDGKQRVKYDSVNTLPVALSKGDAVLYRVQKAAEEPFTVEYKLEG